MIQPRRNAPDRVYAMILFMAVFFTHSVPALAKIDLVTLPDRDRVQTTIYNQADLTLVRDTRVLTFKAGINQLQFSWAGTRIDPTSLSLEIQGSGRDIDVVQMTFPARTKDVGIWEIHCKKAAQVPVEITYFTSGISWQAFYTATLSSDYQTADLHGFVRVNNASGEDYDNAQTRLVVGKVHLLDRIAQLAQREFPYGRPQVLVPQPEIGAAYAAGKQALDSAVAMEAAPSVAMARKPKVIEKKSLSEFFLYTIEGTETIPHGWAKRLSSFKAENIPVKVRYKYDVNRYGPEPVRFVSFKNNKEHHLGITPLPGGRVKVYAVKTADSESGSLNYIGSDRTRYIPLDDEVELNLGAARDIRITPKTMGYKKANFMFDKDKNINGFDEIREIHTRISNFTAQEAVVEITRDLGTPHFQIRDHDTASGVVWKAFEKVDKDTIRYTLTLPPRTERTLVFTLTVFQGERRWHR